MGFDALLGGLVTVFTPEHLLFALLGCVLGMLVGVLPGFGPAAAVSLLIPVTFGLDATTAIIMLAAILYGAAYGGTTTAVLLRIPGEASSIATTLDGYEMAKTGPRRSGPGDRRPGLLRRRPDRRHRLRRGGTLQPAGPGVRCPGAVPGRPAGHGADHQLLRQQPGQGPGQRRVRPGPGQRRHRLRRRHRSASPSTCRSCSTASAWSRW